MVRLLTTVHTVKLQLRSETQLNSGIRNEKRQRRQFLEVLGSVLGKATLFSKNIWSPHIWTMRLSASMAEFAFVNLGSGQGLGRKATHCGINVRWEPSQILEACPLISGRQKGEDGRPV